MKSAKRADPEPPRQDVKKIKTDETLSQSVIKGKELSKKIVDYEEAEAESRMGDEDLEMFRQTCSELQKYMQEIFQLKITAKSEETKKKIAEKRLEASLLFVTLRQLNRLDKLRLKRTRDVTHDVKQRVDSFHLQLENLLYEVFHLRKEVDKCLEFRSKDEDVELIDVEEFYQEAPPAISKPETTRNDEHKLTLARLEWEFEQRKRLSEQCRELETNREKASVSIARKQKELESLLPRLNSVLEATRPLQEELNMPLEKMKYQCELAVLLPDPLYILYSLIKAYSEAVDSSVKVSVEGTKEDAVNFGNKSTSNLDEILEDVDSAESDMETDYKTNKRSASTSGTKVDSQSVRHPLRVQVILDHVCIAFSYITFANLVTVDCKFTNLKDQSEFQVCNAENLLAGIFPNDHGDESAWINPFHAKSFAIGRSHEGGKPYLWAQRLAGLEINGLCKMNDSSHVNSDYVESVVFAIRNRIKHREQLNKILGSLANGHLDLNPDNLACFPAAINSQIASWSPIIYDECVKSFEHSTSLFKHMEVDQKNVMFYRVKIQRDSAKFYAVVAIPMDYPNSPPIFSIELDWHGKHNRLNSEIIRNIEAELNIPNAEIVELDKAFLLNFQLKKLCLHLDLITEIDGHLVKKEQGGWQAQSETEFRPEKMIPQLIKGHNRLLPARYEADSGFFVHRCNYS